MPHCGMENRKLSFPYAIAGVCALLLSACSVSTPLAVSSSRSELGTGLTSGASIALVTVENPSSLKGRFAAALKQALANNSIAISDGAALLADYSIAQSNASGGILRGEGEKVESDEQQDWAAAPRPDGNFDECEAQRLRATFVVFSRTDGRVTYRGTSEAIECSFDNSALAEFAESLVKDAMTGS